MSPREILPLKHAGKLARDKLDQVRGELARFRLEIERRVAQDPNNVAGQSALAAVDAAEGIADRIAERLEKGASILSIALNADSMRQLAEAMDVLRQQTRRRR